LRHEDNQLNPEAAAAFVQQDLGELVNPEQSDSQD
jgi:hypothetical protein